jgi:hypothetical protein
MDSVAYTFAFRFSCCNSVWLLVVGTVCGNWLMFDLVAGYWLLFDSIASFARFGCWIRDSVWWMIRFGVMMFELLVCGNWLMFDLVAG